MWIEKTGVAGGTKALSAIVLTIVVLTGCPQGASKTVVKSPTLAPSAECFGSVDSWIAAVSNQISASPGPQSSSLLEQMQVALDSTWRDHGARPGDPYDRLRLMATRLAVTWADPVGKAEKIKNQRAELRQFCLAPANQEVVRETERRLRSIGSQLGQR